MKSLYCIVGEGKAYLLLKWMAYRNVFLKLSCLMYAILMTFIWSLLPRGFPWWSRPFIEQQVILPIIVLMSWAAAISVVWRLRRGTLCLYMILGNWIGIGLIHIVWFPVFFLPGKFIVVGIGSLGIIGGMILLIFFGWLKSFNVTNLYTMRGGTVWPAMCFGIVLPFLVLFISQAGPAQTNPAEVIPRLEPLSGMTTISDQKQITLVEGASDAVQVRLNQSRSTIEVTTPTGVLDIWPTMNFFSISQNRFWAVLGNRDRSYTEIEHVNKGKYKGADALYIVWSAKSRKARLKPGELSGEILIEQHRSEAPSMEIQVTSITRLTRQIDTHQARYCGLKWSGNVPITLSIGHEQPYEWIPTASDYPFGAPATFMSVMKDWVALLKASSAEKGPFNTLATFPKENPEFRIMASNKPVCQVVLEGFVEQASLELSPTAGWGIPVNSIFLEGVQFKNKQPLGVWIGFSLASTGIGRGFHAVGTGPGMYVSKLRVSIPLDR